MFRYKIIAFIVLFVSCIFGFTKYQSYKNTKELEHYISMIDLNELDNGILIINRNGDISIDEIVFELELEKMVYNVCSSIKVEIVSIDRINNIVSIKYEYEKSSMIVEYELINVNEENGD